MSHCYECPMAKHKRPDSLAIVQRAIGRRITWARELVFPNQSECARLLGVDASTLNKIEKGDRAPSVFLILSLSNRLRVSTDFLLKGVLNGRTDGEMALRLAALHPELVLQQQDTAFHMGKNTPCDMPEPPRRPEGDHS
ncbi:MULTISPECIES: helix-turn-helix domain-containing protein [Asaia]|nr:MULTISPECIES: helix-turn-helix transcriptional regulator [Asaia]GBR12429.1 transcriptional regulator [Asaia spathodeae NBRC 105894]